MKATTQFASDEIRDQHIAYMRNNHIEALKHKRDKTVNEGIRTEQHSLNACINCHVPETYNGDVLRHTHPQHFCTTCHIYVAAKLDCFECHRDHPIESEISTYAQSHFIYVKENPPKSRGVSSKTKKPSKSRGVSSKTENPPKSRGVSSKTENPPKSGGVSSKTENPSKSRGVFRSRLVEQSSVGSKLLRSGYLSSEPITSKSNGDEK